MRKNLILTAVAAMVLSFMSCLPKAGKSYDASNPVAMIEALGNDIASESENWEKEQWDAMADNLETAIRNLPAQMGEDDAAIVASALQRMGVYAERHKRTASELLGVIDAYNQKATAAAAPAPEAAPAAQAPVVQKAAAPQAVPAGLLVGSVIREGGYTNVRQSPSTSAAIVTKIKDGSPIYYKRYNNSWCEIYDQQGQFLGYMHSSKVVASAPTVSAPQTGRVATGTKYDWLAARYVTASDLAGMNSQQLRILRNAIYARHYRKFKDAGLRNFFNQQQWYDGLRDEIPASELNKYETYNIQFIQRYE